MSRPWEGPGAAHSRVEARGKNRRIPSPHPMGMRRLLPPWRPEVLSVEKLRGRAFGTRKIWFRPRIENAQGEKYGT